MRRRFALLFDLSIWPALLVMVLAGVAATVLAFATINLFTESMANIAFIRQHGWVAFEVGAARQIGELALAGGIALIAYLVFKFCETELSVRYRDWINRRHRDRT